MVLPGAYSKVDRKASPRVRFRVKVKLWLHPRSKIFNSNSLKDKYLKLFDKTNPLHLVSNLKP